MAADSHSSNRRLLVFSVAAAAGIFAADVWLSQAFAVGGAYVAWLLISFWSERRRAPLAMAWAATGLLLAGLFLSRADGTPLLFAAANRGVVMVAIWITAAVIVRRKRTETHQGRIRARRRASLRALGLEPDALDGQGAGRLVFAEEEERSRLARHVHDDLVPRLAHVTQDVQDLRTNPARAIERLVLLESQLAELGNDIQYFSHSLYPRALDRLDLAEAIESECRSVEQRFAVWIHLETRNVPRTLPKEAAVCLYRVCQESLSNVAKHSKSEEAKVLLEAADEGLTLVVSDSGVGFDPETTTGRLGLLGMRERVRLANGRFDVRSQRGAGTKIVVFVPVAWTDEGLAQAAHA
jgi:signal transduction histidine kinase